VRRRYLGTLCACCGWATGDLVFAACEALQLRFFSYEEFSDVDDFLYVFPTCCTAFWLCACWLVLPDYGIGRGFALARDGGRVGDYREHEFWSLSGSHCHRVAALSGRTASSIPCLTPVRNDGGFVLARICRSMRHWCLQLRWEGMA